MLTNSHTNWTNPISGKNADFLAEKRMHFIYELSVTLAYDLIGELARHFAEFRQQNAHFSAFLPSRRSDCVAM
jgi:hypothetical protein